MADARDILDRAGRDAAGVLGMLREDGGIRATFGAVTGALVKAFKAGGKVLVCGNGGSMCDAMHFAEELTGRFRNDRPALGAIALADPTHITCVGNDFGFDHIFSRGVEALGRAGDVLVVLSTSGNSENIVRAVAAGRARGLVLVSLLGKGGGRLKGACEHEFVVAGATSDRIQELHMLLLHTLVEAVEAEMGF